LVAVNSSWEQRFFDPITVPGRKPLVTLRDAAEYITELPKAEHEADEWQAALGSAVTSRSGIYRSDPQTRNECLICRNIDMAASVYRPWVRY